MTLWIVNLVGLLLIAAIVYWFWLSKPKSRKLDSDTVEILVDNGVYTPARIEVPVGKVTKLTFLRKDPSPCAEKVLIDDLGLSTDLPLDQPLTLEVAPDKPGDYEFTCQMRMYRGNLIAK